MEIIPQDSQKAAFLGNSTNTAVVNPTISLYELLAKAQDTLRPIKHRTCGCSNFVSFFNNPDLDVPVVSDGKKHSFKNVTVCGSVWSCPVCAYKIQSVRTNQMISAMKKNRELGGSCIFATLTFPHTRADILEKMLICFTKSLSTMKGKVAFRRACDSLGIHSKVRSLEVTWGRKNGWHPHSHEVYFSDRILTVSEIKNLESKIFEQWVIACKKSGLGEPSRRYGIDIRYMKSSDDDEKIGSYMCKFSHEVVMSGSKYARQKDRYTPFSMLQALNERYSYELANRFREYSVVFKGRRQLFGLSELLKKFDIEDCNEIEAAERGIVREVVDVLTLAEYNSISYYKKQSHVIALYDSVGRDTARAYISSLCRKSADKFSEINQRKYQLRKEIENQTYVAMIREGLSEYTF